MLVCLILLLILLCLIVLRLCSRDPSVDVPDRGVQAPTGSMPITEGPVVRKKIPESELPEKAPPTIPYGSEDGTFQEIMDRRKSAYGLDKSVDMIVRPDESLRLGDATVSMKDIIDQIQIREGGIVEKDLQAKRVDPAVSDAARMDKAEKRMSASVKRFENLEASLSRQDQNRDDLLREQIRERAVLSRRIEPFRAYRDALDALAEYEKLAAAKNPREILARKAAELSRKRDELETALRRMLGGDIEISDNEAGGQAFFEELNRLAARFDEILSALNNPEAADSTASMRSRVQEWAAMRDIVGRYREYQRTVRALEVTQGLIGLSDADLSAHIRSHLALLQVARDDLKRSLMDEIIPSSRTDVYGVYVVRPGDNIWNIHFTFLKEYFAGRNIAISMKADEPDPSGESSGVGKILKFSEGMVYIYNLRERRVSEDLDLIHPLSKIVVFNMGRALDLLARIDSDRIKQVRFDGETLWIPTE